MTINSMVLGYQPEALHLILVTGSDFTTTLTLNEPWPDGSTLVLKVGDLTWNATISASDATFSVDKAVADTVSDGAAARLLYTHGTTDQVWAIGKVVRHG